VQTDEYRKMFELEDHYWWFVGRRNLALRLLKKYTHPKSEGPMPRILDLGCGTGVVSRELGAWSKPVSLDMSELALGFSKRRGLTQMVRARGESLPFMKDSFDAVVALDIFEHIEDDVSAFGEAARVLKPGGVLVLSVPAFKSLWGPHDVALMHHRRYRKAQIGELLRTSGLKPERISYSVFFLFPAVVGVRIIERRRKGPAKASLIKVPRWLNQSLIGLQNVESRLISGAPLPWGSSVVAVARKV
jgi:SAM-dependent methyltransferase